MVRPGAVFLMLFAGAFAGGCAGQQSGAPPSLIPKVPLSNDAAALSYRLSETEKKYNCKKLTGIMQVRILQIRDYDSSDKATLAARGLQVVTTPIFGGTTTGTNPDAQYRKDRAMLEAYNRRLAEKKCKTFDLAAELQRRGLHDMPRPKDARTDAKKGP